MKPEQTPIGLSISRAARLVGRGFDEALAEVGGSLPMWLVLLNLKAGRAANQRELAAAVGVTGATLTHHLNGFETAGLLTRTRDPENRRNHILALTESGEAMFKRLMPAVLGFDQQLRADLTADEVDTLRGLLDRVAANVDPDQSGPPWTGLLERKPADTAAAAPADDEPGHKEKR
jgi:MarR family transcriptional regulator, transcriptional regulator for hemolysin